MYALCALTLFFRFQACNFDLDNGSGGSACFGDTSKVLLAVARSSGKLITFTLLTGLIVCNKLVTSGEYTGLQTAAAVRQCESG